ncbi:rab family small GTPase [Naegleria gruberi]|uniref:Ras-related protein Rab n=1 Tax=Naegleria gruberi TaxID=5762 RepID=D2VNF9_NAEGR|nr:rab family small GTPase [Naegleria gruberi]EFC41652.1 rab family small GTPase [Naegleria gruberi]|eukprot:XP_002674396.1 rab family small GTPase [Naegleria gruberi strain NEG-M]
MSNTGGEVQEYLYKILVVGDIGTGKTSIIKRYVHNIFSNTYKSTIGVDFALKVLNWDDNIIIRLQLWDIAGQERFGSMTRVYYKEAVGAFVVYDITRPPTFEAVQKWKSDIEHKVFLPDERPIPCVLLANKCDLPSAVSKSKEEMDQYCQENGFIGWFETSAKDDKNINEAANFLVKKILENHAEMNKQQGEEQPRDDVVQFSEKPQSQNPKPSSSGGCQC